jgi:hypothetical protein
MSAETYLEARVRPKTFAHTTKSRNACASRNAVCMNSFTAGLQRLHADGAYP